jgi:hypothetical protein
MVEILLVAINILNAFESVPQIYIVSHKSENIDNLQ